MPGFGVVVNPHAGQNRRERNRARRLTEAVGDVGVVHETASLDEMEEVARELYARRIDVVAICGGDGSFFRTLSALVRVYGATPLPKFLPLRAGSMNTIARSVGCRHGTPERVLAHAVADYRAGRPFESTERQLIEVGGRHYGFMVGCGAIVNFLQVYYAGSARGPWAAAMLFARYIASMIAGSALARGLLQPVEADVDCDGERVPHRRFNVIYASSVTDIGLGFQATYLATRKPGYFHLLAGRLRAGQVVSRLHRLRRGWPLEVSSLYDNLARQVRVEFAKPTHYMVDGDVLEAISELVVRAGPRLTIIQK
jgi:diacylglycerol kinase family enzyme